MTKGGRGSDAGRERHGDAVTQGAKPENIALELVESRESRSPRRRGPPTLRARRMLLWRHRRCPCLITRAILPPDEKGMADTYDLGLFHPWCRPRWILGMMLRLHQLKQDPFESAALLKACEQHFRERAPTACSTQRKPATHRAASLPPVLARASSGSSTLCSTDRSRGARPQLCKESSVLIVSENDSAS